MMFGIWLSSNKLEFFFSYYAFLFYVKIRKKTLQECPPFCLDFIFRYFIVYLFITKLLFHIMLLILFFISSIKSMI